MTHLTKLETLDTALSKNAKTTLNVLKSGVSPKITCGDKTLAFPLHFIGKEKSGIFSVCGEYLT